MDHHSRSRPHRLGVKPGHSVQLVGVTDAGFIADLQARGARITRTGRPDAMFCAVETRAALQRLPELAGRLKRTGTLWTITAIASPLVSHEEVVSAARAASLKPVRKVRFSATHAATQFVVRPT